MNFGPEAASNKKPEPGRDRTVWGVHVNKLLSGAVLVIAGLIHTGIATADESLVPEPFRGYDNTSTMSISYDDLSSVLDTVVVDIGYSTRRVAKPADDVTGTRMKAKVSMTANEGNRFYFEAFEDDEDSQEFLRNIQKSLEELPNEVPLEYFSRDEQLAYWLNLYNVTVLNELIALYPKRNLKKQVEGKRSIFAGKLLTVAGVPLSLDDIQFKILRNNYDNDPLVIYGLYQGIIGAPSIRKRAYTGATVRADLEDNAREFVNSNRGTFSKYGDRFRVSSFYERSKKFFPKFESDLTKHLLTLLNDSYRTKLENAGKFQANINDWTITDLAGSQRRIGGSLADSRAALLDSAVSTVADPNNPGKTLPASIGAFNSFAAAKGKRISGIQPEVLILLNELNEKRMAENERNAVVEIEDIVEDGEDE